MAFEFVSAVVDQNFSAAFKQLEAAVKAKKEQNGTDVAGLALLCLNKGFCNQRLQLYRKALKVGID